MLRLWLGSREYRISRSMQGTSAPVADPVTLFREAVYAGHGVSLRSLLYPATLAPSWLSDTQLVDQAVAAFQQGQLAIEPIEARAVTWAAVGGSDDVAGPAEPVETTTEAPETWFELRLVDEIGSPIEGVTLRMTPGGPRPTDGAGAARVTVPVRPQGGGEVQSLEELRAMVAPRWNAARPEPWIEDAPRQSFIPLVGSPSTSVALPAERPYTLVIQPWVVRAQLDGLVFDTNKCFLLPDAVHRAAGGAPIDRLREWFEAHPDTTALVVGHTDPSGDPSYNDPLSVERAESFVAYLERDVDHWLAYYTHPSWEKRWGIHEDRSMLQALAERWGFPVVGRVQAFQTWAGIDVDGAIGPQTRRALVRAYMDLQDTSTAMPAQLVAHGCGESFPKMEKPDAAGVEGTVVDPDMEDQRRVEVFLFPAATGVQPPPPGSISSPSSVEYPEWVRRARHTRDLRASAGLARLVARVGKRSDMAEPVADAEVTLTRPDDEAFSLVAFSGSDGLARFEGLDPGLYHVRADKALYEGDARTVQVRRSGVTDEDDVVMGFGGGAGGGSGGGSDAHADEVPLGMESELRITKLAGTTPHWPPTDPSSEGHAQWASTGLVYFRQGADIVIEWEVQSPEAIEVELERMGVDPGSGALVEKTTRWVSKTPGKIGADPADRDVTGPTRVGTDRWKGSVRLSLRAREPDGSRNPTYAPPRAGNGGYKLWANEDPDIYMLDDRVLPVAGIAFFGAVGAGLKATTQAGAGAAVPVIHAQHGSLFDDDQQQWTTAPHGYGPARTNLELAWELVGTDHADMQLEVLGAEPVNAGDLTTLTLWPLQKMSLVQHPLNEQSSRVVLNDLVTLRAMVHVFAKGKAQTPLSEAQWSPPPTDDDPVAMSTERYGGSALRVAEDRPVRILPWTAEGASGKTPVIALTPFSHTQGYYRAHQEQKPPAPTDADVSDEYNGQPIAVEIIERAGRIWGASLPNRPMALWHVFAHSGHKTHGYGRSWDLLPVRTDDVEEYRIASPTAYAGFTKDMDETTAKTFIETMGKDADLPEAYAKRPKADVQEAKDRMDRLKMERLLQLFVDLVPLCAGKKKRKNLHVDQLVFNDKEIVKNIRERRKMSPLTVGTEQETGVLQGTHGWHAHVFLQHP